MKAVKSVLLPLLFAGVLFCSGCDRGDKETLFDTDSIRLELVERKEAPEGWNFTIRLRNDSGRVIKQNNVYLSFPIRSENGNRSNEFKIEARNNKLDIQPGEEVLLVLFAPQEMYAGNPNIDPEDPYLEIEGYLDKVTVRTHFQKIGGAAVDIGK